MKKQMMRQQMWDERIEQWRESGKPVTTWCRENRVCYNTLLYWRRKIEASVFIELKSSDSSAVELHLNGMSVFVKADCDEMALALCLKVMRAAL